MQGILIAGIYIVHAALTAYSITILSYRFAHRHGIGAPTSDRFNKWSRIAYYYWIAAYITGAILVMARSKDEG